MIEETITRQVDFCDVDSTGVMWHGNYCKYYEAARCYLLDKLGISYKEIQKNNHQIPLVQLSIKYSSPCYFSQELLITAQLVNTHHFLEFQYFIRDKETGKILSKAESKHAYYDRIKQKALINPPEFIVAKINNIQN